MNISDILRHRTLLSCGSGITNLCGVRIKPLSQINTVLHHFFKFNHLEQIHYYYFFFRKYWTLPLNEVLTQLSLSVIQFFFYVICYVQFYQCQYCGCCIKIQEWDFVNLSNTNSNIKVDISCIFGYLNFEISCFVILNMYVSKILLHNVVISSKISRLCMICLL